MMPTRSSRVCASAELFK
jgi:hypothetical protein